MPRLPHLVFLGLLCLVTSMPSRAQDPGTPPPGGSAARAGGTADARRALEILRDDKRRAELIGTLEAIVAAGGAPASAPPPASGAGGPGAGGLGASGPGIVGLGMGALGGTAAADPAKPAEPALQLAPDSLGARMLLETSAKIRELAAEAEETFFAVGDLPWLVGWLYSALTEPLMRSWILAVAWRLALVVAVGLALAALVRRSLGRARRTLDARIAEYGAAAREVAAERALARAEEGDVEAPGVAPIAAADGQVPLIRRIPLALGLLGLDLAPVLAFLVGSHAMLATPLGGSQLSQLVIAALTQAAAVWRASLAIMGALTAPGHAPARLLPMADETAVWLRRWTGRIAAIAFFTAASLQSALLLGLPRPAHAGWLKVASLACVACVVIMVAQRRREVAAWLRGDGKDAGLFGDARRILAPVWHWLATGYLLTMWVVWAADYGVGEVHVLTAMISTVVVLLAMRLVAAGIIRGLEHKLAVPAELAARYPGIESRAHGYRPLMRGMVGTAVTVAGLLVLGEIWGLSPLVWLFTSRTGRDMLASLGTIGTTLLLTFAVWEAVNLGMSRHVARLQARGDTARSSRLRTLQPMLRTALLVSIVIVVGLTVLSQIGVNIAPLLAGAGVLGLAIGIGSQKLVQDLITGLFLLLENAMQVGDVVTLGGATGVVEELTVRSIRLRSEDGSVQIIPFSAVTSVTNMTRDFSQAVFEVQLGYGQDYNEAVSILNGIVTAMRTEPLWEGEILADLEVQGLVRFETAGMTLKCRVRCGPFARWKVLREVNRRMQERFGAVGIDWMGA